ncbi:MAG TPA: ABC transporter ATP-binding protein [Pilimelia sp.]|nr:ABC transporter ATP-binding protein [Pilimelia sp.]
MSDAPTSGPTSDDAPRRGVAVATRDLTRHFGTGESRITACAGVTLDIAANSLVAMTGPSGSGKSTLLHLIGAVERADGGTITVGDTEVTALGRKHLPAYRRTVGFVFQRFHLLPALTVLDNVLAPTLAVRADRDAPVRARELLDAVGLGHRADALPAELSGGQQQRVAISRALIARPRLLLTDEPTGALDSQTGRDILELLLDLRRRFGMTLLIATHERHIADSCERRVSLRDGEVVDDTAT